MTKLLYHAGALGDFITSLPAARAWRGTERTILLGRPAYAPLADPPFAAVWDAGGALFAPLFAPGARPTARLVDMFSGVRSAFLFSGAGSPLVGNLRALGVTDVLRQDPFPDRGVPIVDHHLAAVAGVAAVAAPEGEAPRIALPATPPFPVEPSTAAIGPGSGSPAKNWPMDRFEELARRLEGRGMSVAWIQGPAEEGLRLPAGARAWRNLPLPALAAALSRCALYAGNDSGVTHLAAASGCPTVALFGASDPVVWAPRGRRVRVVSSGGNGMFGVSVGEVFAACLDLCV